jgi:hypothetical protein
MCRGQPEAKLVACPNRSWKHPAVRTDITQEQFITRWEK